MKTENVLVFTYWNYSDALIQTYTLPYVKIIRNILPESSKIILVTLEKEHDDKTNFNLPPGIIHYPLTYTPFGLKAIYRWIKKYRQLKRLIKTEKITTIHAWCTPAGSIAYFLAKKTKTQLVIDSFEPHAEAMVENGTWKKNSFAFKLLFRLEKKQTHFATHLIAAASGMEVYAREKYAFTGSNYFYKPACVDFSLFDFTKRKNKDLINELGLENKIVCVYAGKFGGIYYEEEVFDFISLAQEFFGSQFRFLLLSTYPEVKRKQFESKKKIHEQTIIQRFVPHHQIADYIGTADFAITPVKPVPTKKYCTPIKDGEYWAMGLPVVISKNISNDSELIRTYKIGYVLEDYSKKEILMSFEEIRKLLSEKSNISSKIMDVAKQHRNFSIAEKIYATIYQQ